jgi:hypothetical protein
MWAQRNRWIHPGTELRQTESIEGPAVSLSGEVDGTEGRVEAVARSLCWKIRRMEKGKVDRLGDGGRGSAKDAKEVLL